VGFSSLMYPEILPGLANHLTVQVLLCAFRGLVMQQLAAILLLDGPTPRKMKLPATHRRIPQILMHTRDDCHTVVV
jgi:hypothetical protein